MNRLVPTCIALGLLCAATGCHRSGSNLPKPYNGETQTMDEVVAAINANNAPIVTLYSDHHFSARFHDDKKRVRSISGDGALLYRKSPTKPDELFMTGEVLAGQKVFELGSADAKSGKDAEYWLAITPPNEEGTEWWGRYKNLDKPCAKQIPIQPTLVTEVLGVMDIDSNFLEPPVPVMRFNNDADVYMFTWMAPLPDRWWCTKEIWFDRVTKLPKNVLLFDKNGRILVRAYLRNYKVVEGTQGKKIATQYDLLFPDSDDRMTIVLEDPMLQFKGRPTEQTIRRRQLPDVQEIQIDENCP